VQASGEDFLSRRREPWLRLLQWKGRDGTASGYPAKTKVARGVWVASEAAKIAREHDCNSRPFRLCRSDDLAVNGVSRRLRSTLDGERGGEGGGQRAEGGGPGEEGGLPGDCDKDGHS
jgi:hypothetical protein